jgi:hypothetical protein
LLYLYNVIGLCFVDKHSFKNNLSQEESEKEQDHGHFTPHHFFIVTLATSSAPPLTL